MESIDSSDSTGNVGTLDIDIALGGGFVNVDVDNTSVLVTFLYHVISDLLKCKRVKS